MTWGKSQHPVLFDLSKYDTDPPKATGFKLM
jgi:hypothetical protein